MGREASGRQPSRVSVRRLAVGALILLWLALPATSEGAVTFGEPPPHYPLDFQPNSVAVADLDRDGNLDLAVADELGTPRGNVAILLGRADGSFSGPTNFATGPSPFSVAASDFDGDGVPDLAVGHVPDGISILIGNGDGTFSAPSELFTGNDPSSIVAADFNGDSHADLAARGSDNKIRVFLGDGDGTFTGPTGFSTGFRADFLAVGDLNGDLHSDLVYTGIDFSANTDKIAVMLGDGAGGFLPPSSTPLGGAYSVTLGDVNADGRVDAVVPDFNEGVYLLPGDGAGGFGAPNHLVLGSPFRALFAAIADFDGDGKVDLAILGPDRPGAAIMLGLGGGSFTPPTNFFTHEDFYASSFGLGVADFNRDGRLDIAMSTRYPASDVSVLFNRTGFNYPRPKGATPLRASLAVAYRSCTSPNAMHGGPLSAGSCEPPAQASPNLTVGTPDANGAQANSVGSVRFDVKANPSDVSIHVSVTDVRCQLSGVSTCGSTNMASGPDYTGELQETTVLRMTDLLNSAGGYDTGLGTAEEVSFPVTVPCSSTSDRKIGSTCLVATTANAVLPGSVQGGARSDWELGNVQVLDGGLDGDADTSGDNYLFMDEGIFVP